MAESPGARVLTANEELITEGGLDRIADFFSSDYVAHFTEQDWEGGHDAIRGFLTAQRAAFPDLRIEVEILVECEKNHMPSKGRVITRNGSVQDVQLQSAAGNFT